MLDRIQQIQTRIQEIRSLLGLEAPPNRAFGSALEQALTAETGASAEVPPGAGAFELPSLASEPAVAIYRRPAGPRVMSANARQAAEELRPLIETAAAKHDLDPDLLSAVIRAESGYRTNAVSPAGAMGLMQLMPGTARGLGVSDPFNAGQSIEGGARYLRSQITRFGSVEEGLAAYNAGPGAVGRYGGIPPFAETRSYVGRVLEFYQQHRADTLAGAGTDD